MLRLTCHLANDWQSPKSDIHMNILKKHYHNHHHLLILFLEGKAVVIQNFRGAVEKWIQETVLKRLRNVSYLIQEKQKQRRVDVDHMLPCHEMVAGSLFKYANVILLYGWLANNRSEYINKSQLHSLFLLIWIFSLCLSLCGCIKQQKESTWGERNREICFSGTRCPFVKSVTWSSVCFWWQLHLITAGLAVSWLYQL